jgi:O-antigen/teichoic acid export membrane protein
LGAVHFIDYSIGLIYSIASLGVPAYGMYRIAQLQALDQTKRKAYVQMTALHVSLSILGFGIFYWILQGHTNLIYIQKILPLAGIHLLANSAAAEWYLQGKQRFDIPAYRNLALRILGLIALFLLVLHPTDYSTYYAIVVISLSITMILNNWWVLKDLQSDQHKQPGGGIQWKQLFLFYLSTVFISTTDFLDVTLLGLLSSEAQVGYYSNAAKLLRLSLMIPLALNLVISPQFSSNLAKDNHEESDKLLYKALDWLFYLTVPICSLYLLYADDLVHLFSGSQFTQSISAMRWMAGIPLFISLSNLLIYYGLSDNKSKVRSLLSIGILLGLLGSCCLNFWLIPQYGSIGASINSLIIESSLVIFFLVLFKIRLDWKSIAKAGITSLCFIPIYWGLVQTGWNSLTTLIVGGSSSVGMYLLIQHYIWKHSFVPELGRTLFKKQH